jgi:uncharacterized protein
MQDGLERGIALFNAREFFQCHEVLEDIWMHEKAPRKRFLQSIIHYAVAFYHEGRANRVGALRQLRKGIAKLAPYVPVYEGVDTSRMFDEGLRCLAALEQGNTVNDVPFIHMVPEDQGGR